MKKLSFLLAILMIAGLTISASAADTYVMDGAGTATITYTEQSRCCIVIPETIDLDAGTYYFQATEMNITDDEKVTVSISTLNSGGMLELTHENGTDKLERQLYYDYGSMPSAVQQTLLGTTVGYFEQGDTSSQMGFYLQSDMEGTTKAGKYSGTATFWVKIEDK